MSIESHIVQFRLHFYKGDSIIKSKQDLNHIHIYSPENNKIHRQEYFTKNEPFLKEMGDYSEGGDCSDNTYFHFYTPKDIFYIEYLHEIGDFDFDDTNHITKWLDESFNEDEAFDFYRNIREIYNDVRKDIDKYFESKGYLCKFVFERLINIQTNSYTTGYEYVEYECDYSYNGIFKLNLNS